MAEYRPPAAEFEFFRRPRKKKPKVIVNIILIVLTFISTTIAGVMWVGKEFTEISNWHYGITYSLLIMGFLTAHEFGHYFAARYHKVDATLPYYIPLPILFGTMGAVIKTRSPIPTKKALFDIGVTGPLAGFVVCVVYLIAGLQTLPSIDYIYDIHPEYLVFNQGHIPNHGLHFGNTLLYGIFSSTFANPDGFLPPMNEIYHYPFLCVGWFGLFVTALNMLPMGQLDGGHVLYAMFGRKQWKFSRILWWVIFVFGLSAIFGLVHDLLAQNFDNSFLNFLKSIIYQPLNSIKTAIPWIFDGWGGWLLWALVVRIFIKIEHPPIAPGERLDNRRMVIGAIALLILVFCLSPNAAYFVEPA